MSRFLLPLCSSKRSAMGFRMLFQVSSFSSLALAKTVSKDSTGQWRNSRNHDVVKDP